MIPELTCTEQSSADVLGVPGTVLANRLAAHLAAEIIVRGSGGGPLTPLADQFNHELTRLIGTVTSPGIQLGFSRCSLPGIGSAHPPRARLGLLDTGTEAGHRRVSGQEPPSIRLWCR
jgi:hypothetical protein